MGSSFDQIPAKSSERHVVLFPFMSKGHTIPLLQLARFLLRRGDISVTIISTPADFPFISDFLSGTSAAVVTIPFQANLPGLPAGTESPKNLPSNFISLVSSTELMKPDFEQIMKTLTPRVSFLISDGFLWWTQESAAKLGVPRLVSYGMSCYAMAIQRDFELAGKAISGSAIAPSFPWITVTDKDIPAIFTNPSLDPVHYELMKKCADAATKSSGMVVNSFIEIESAFVEHWNRKIGPKAWCVGPLCLADAREDALEPYPKYLRWLDEKAERGERVIYVAFGSQAEISAEKTAEIAKGLIESGVDFLWVIEKTPMAIPEISERGFVVREWADQRKILNHRSVKGFMSHCGWNSVTESLCAAVPILAWPIAAEQPLNALNVTEELKIGARVVEAERFMEFVTWQEIAKRVKEFMTVDCEEVKVNVERLAAAAKEAVAEGGSSWKALEALVEEMT